MGFDAVPVRRPSGNGARLVGTPCRGVPTPVGRVPAVFGSVWNPLQARVHGFAFEGEDAEDALVDAVEGVPADEALQGLDAEGELAQG